MPVRFKYRHVEPVNYGLDTAEILLADDKELNQWVGLRKVTKYRPQYVVGRSVRRRIPIGYFLKKEEPD
jgi:protein KRI1